MRNVATMQNMTNDMNMHGRYEGHLLELNYVSVSYNHRSRRYAFCFMFGNNMPNN
jgi:hypothetical protein